MIISNCIQRLYSPSGKTYYRQMLWILEAAELDVTMFVSLWNSTAISAALLTVRSYSKTSVRLVNISPCIDYFPYVSAYQATFIKTMTWSLGRLSGKMYSKTPLRYTDGYVYLALLRACADKCIIYMLEQLHLVGNIVFSVHGDCRKS